MARTQAQNEIIREKSKQQILDAAFELFATIGFTSASIQAIAKKAGVSKGLIYHYFSSKDHILESIFSQLSEISDEIMEEAEELNPAARFKQILDSVFDYIVKHTELMRLMISLALQPAAMNSLQPYIREQNQNQIEAMKALLTALGHDDAKNEALYVAAKLDGICVGYLTLGDKYPLEKMKLKLLNEYVSS